MNCVGLSTSAIEDEVNFYRTRLFADRIVVYPSLGE